MRASHVKADVKQEGHLHKLNGHPHPAGEIMATGVTLTLGPGADPDVVRYICSHSLETRSLS